MSKPFNTLSCAKNLIKAGQDAKIAEAEAQAIYEALQELTTSHLATKTDILSLKKDIAELKHDITKLFIKFSFGSVGILSATIGLFHHFS